MDKAADKDQVGFNEVSLSDPVFSTDWIEGKIDGIHAGGLASRSGWMLERIRAWLQEILDNWPNRPPEK